jgi:hypothetical protein
MKIAILPYSNLDGNFDLNQYCYQLQDSLTKAFDAIDPEHQKIVVIPVSTVNAALTAQGIDANTPTFDTDKWNIVPALQVDRIISGNFRITSKRFLINSYIYYPDNQMQDPDFRAKDIFKKEEAIFDAIPMIVRQLSKAFGITPPETE